MNDEEEKDESKPSTRFLTGRDVLEFVKAKWKNYKCDACGIDAWTVGEKYSEGIIGGMIPTDDGEYSVGGRLRNFAFATCDNCGYVRLIAVVPIYRWMRERADG